jgi:hypothetical protein
MTGPYTPERAFARVEMLKRAGIWPGVRLHADGSASLTCDPQVSGRVQIGDRS